MLLYSFVVLISFICFIRSEECSISKVNKKFQVQTHDELYYLFSRDREKFQKAHEVCRNINGYLTDLTVNTVTFFKTSSISGITYWIGLLWTPSLENQVWDSGRRYIDQKRVPERRLLPLPHYHYCMVIFIKSGNREWKDCHDLHTYICMLDSASVQKTDNDTINNDTCLLINNALSGTSTPPELNKAVDIDNITTPIPCLRNTNDTNECVNDTDNLTTPIPSLPNTNATNECVNVTYEQTTAGKGNCDCQKLSQSEAVTPSAKDEILVLVLAVILTASLIANFVTGIVICFVLRKYRNVNKEKLRAVSMTDILNVDSSPMPPPSPQDFYTDVDQDTPADTGNMHSSCTKKNSASLYYSDEDKNKDGSMGTAVDDLCYTQPSRQTKTNDYEESVLGIESSRDEMLSYSHLHETNGHASAGDNVYGIESPSTCLNTPEMSASDGQNKDVQVIVLEQEPGASDELHCNA